MQCLNQYGFSAKLQITVAHNLRFALQYLFMYVEIPNMYNINSMHKQELRQ